jgi:hypothetical protein
VGEHTPGPWQVGDGQGNGHRDYIYCDDATGSAVATVELQYAPRNPLEQQANARLIAAAPDMLAALKKHERVLSMRTTYGAKAKPTVQELNDMLDDFRAAIAKATAER